MVDPRNPTLPPVVVVTGPTAAGKTGIAIELAERFAGEIVNADSMQVYRFLDLGTAKPTPAERARVPHHLLDVVNPDVRYSAGRYTEEGRLAAEGIHKRGKVVFLAGGTGLYIRAFLEGLIDAGAADNELRARLEDTHVEAVAAGDPARLHRRLAKCDPTAAQRIHPHDIRRLIRALEIVERTGQPPSRMHANHARQRCPYRVLHLVFDPGRERLDERIARRCHAMIEAGLLQEVRSLCERGFGPELRSLQAIGYRHMAPVIRGSETLANAETQMARDTRGFARRQRTWLRRVSSARWLDPDDRAQIRAMVNRFLEE